MDRLTLMPWQVALFVGLMTMTPLDIYKICAWNAGTMKLEPWLHRTAGSIERMSRTIRTWIASIWTERLAVICLVVVTAVIVAHFGGLGGHEGIAMAAAPAAVKAKGLAKRAKLIREANALRNQDGTFQDDAARQAFDAKMAEIEAIDGTSREESETIAPTNPVDPDNAGRRDLIDDDDEPNETDEAVQAERDRCSGILLACRTARMPQSFADRLIQEDVPLVEAQTRVFKELARRGGQDRGPGPGPSGSGDIVVGDDPLVHVRAGIENALLHRTRPKTAADKNGFELDDKGKQYRGMTLLRIAEAFLNGRGVRTSGMGKMQIAGLALGLDQRAHTTADFPNLLADVANKNLRRAYEEAPQTWRPFSRQVTIPDFKPRKVLQLGEAPALLQVGEHGEFTFGTIGEGKEQYALATYGRRFAITRQSLINDDTEAFARVPSLFGRSARNLESDTVWGQITANAAMGDTIALFHASHNNLSGTSDAISVASIGAGRAAMRVQKGVDGVTLLNINPAFLLVPATKETIADQFVSQNLLASASSSVNPFAGKLQVIAEPRLDANSTVSWYLAATVDQIDIVEYAYLEGSEGPTVESRLGWEVDGLEIKCREDFAAKVIDFRGLWKNPGA